MPYDISVNWINFHGIDITQRLKLNPGEQYAAQTFFTHNWGFNKSGTDVRLLAKANGMKSKIFEGCRFKALPSDRIVVTVAKGTYIFVSSKIYDYE